MLNPLKLSSRKHKRHKSDKRDGADVPSIPEKPPGLKLILKVGGNVSTPEHSNDSFGTVSMSASTHGEKHKKMKKKKKKKEKDRDKSKDRHEKKHKHRHKDKKKRSHDESSEVDQQQQQLGSTTVKEESGGEPAAKKVAPPKLLKPPGSPAKGSMSPRSVEAREREQRACVVRLKMEQSPFTKLLDHILKLLEKKDPKQFFAWPVTDNFAPGYSNVISNPMDFSTIKQKIDEHVYKNLQEFTDDFKLMCENAMTYNHQDTIYYKAARKLVHYGVKALSQERVAALQAILPFMDEVTSEQLGFEMPAARAPAEQTPAEDKPADVKPAVEKPREPRKPKEMPKSKFEAITDNLTPEEILEDVQAAAGAAANKLTARKCGQMGFLRQRKDGTTSLNIVVPGHGGSNERPVSLGVLIGKLQHGTGTLHGFKEDRRNLIKGVKPLNYGPFGSYAPSYDSTFANLTKEESELVYQTYGDDTCVQYAESILDFAKDSDYTLTMVDNLLDIVTGGDHRRTKRVLDERKRLREEEEKLLAPPPAPAPPPLPAHIDFNSLRSLSSLGIDTSFLDTMEKSVRKREATQTAADAMQARLDNTCALIQKLEMVQSERLSQEPPPHLSHIPGPSNAEINLAALVTDSLVDISQRLPPEAVASLPAVRKALGVAAIVQEPAVPDLESELREFLESQSALAVDDDKTIEEILSQS